MSLRDTIHAEISLGKYECIICYENINKKSHIWNCSDCYRSFDLKCVKKWWTREADSKNGFRCPFCRSSVSKSTVQKASYRCWCRKEAAPAKKHPYGGNSHFDTATPPHSCGQTCGAKRKCPHPCPLVCHAGPHLDPADCMYMGPKIRCYCGRHSEQVLCSETKYEGFSCGEKCQMKNPICGHKCSKKCHKCPTSNNRGKKIECGPCEVPIKVGCFCEKSKKTTRLCHTLPSEYRRTVRTTRNTTKVSCGQECGKLLSCGIHKCLKQCHEGSLSTEGHECPRLPYAGETCFCGAQKADRKSCLDEVSSCGQKCHKKLDCGHLCEDICHFGDCSPCGKVLEGVQCRCHNNTLTTTCGEALISPPVCEKKCGALLNCGRHHCADICCSFSPKKLRDLQASIASKHKKATKKNAYNLLESNFNTSVAYSHSNSRVDRHLARSANVNQGILHEDSTDSDFELAVFLSGSDIAHSCNKVCNRPLSCGSHFCPLPCHSGKCSPCKATSFDEWNCPCGRTKLDPPIVCGTPLPECTYPCHREQPCGHRATHECHSDDIGCPSCAERVLKVCLCGKNQVPVRCDQENVRCKEKCGNKLDCGHECPKICCPGGSQCLPCTSMCGKMRLCGHIDVSHCHSSDTCPPCSNKLVAVCPCGALKAHYECGEDLEISCNGDCLKEAYSEMLLDAYRDEKSWISSLELQVRTFVGNTDKKTLWLPPMGARHRKLAHLLLQHYGIDGQSIDSGPNRSICGYRCKSTWLCRRRLRDAPKGTPKLEMPRLNLYSSAAISILQANLGLDKVAQAHDDVETPTELGIEQPAVSAEADGMITVNPRNSNNSNSEGTAPSPSIEDVQKQLNSFSLLANEVI